MIQLKHLIYGKIKQPLTVVDANCKLMGSALMFGPMGSGKTTLLELLCGISDDNYYGELLLDGVAPAEARVTYLPANVVGFMGKTVYKNLQFACDQVGADYGVIENLDPWVKIHKDYKLKNLSPYNLAYFALVRAKIKDAKFVFIDVNLQGFSEKEIALYASNLQQLIGDSKKQVVIALSAQEYKRLNLTIGNSDIWYLFAGKLYSYNNLQQFSKSLPILSMAQYVYDQAIEAEIALTANGYILRLGGNSFKLKDNFVGGVEPYLQSTDASAKVCLVGVQTLDNLTDEQFNNLLATKQIFMYDAITQELLNN